MKKVATTTTTTSNKQSNKKTVNHVNWQFGGCGVCIFASSMEKWIRLKLFYALIDHRGAIYFVPFGVYVCACAVLLSPQFASKRNRDKKYVLSRVVCVPSFYFFLFSLCFIGKKSNQIKSATRYRIEMSAQRNELEGIKKRVTHGSACCLLIEIKKRIPLHFRVLNETEWKYVCGGNRKNHETETTKCIFSCLSFNSNKKKLKWNQSKTAYTVIN